MNTTAPRLRQSLAKILLTECPLLVRQALDGERRQGTKAMRRGSLVDQLVFGGAQYEVVQARLKSGKRKGELATNWLATEAQEMRDAIEAKGWVPVLEHELESAQELAGRIKAELILAGLDLTKCELQRPLQWETMYGVAAEGTPDVILTAGGHAHTIDLKVGEDANPDQLDHQVGAMMWDLQGAAYQEAIGNTGQHWILRADAKSKLIGLYPLDEGYMTIGRGKWAAAQKLWKECLASNEWPGYKRRPITPSQATMQRAISRGWIQE